MKTTGYILLAVLLLALAACSSPEIEEGHFKDAKALRQSSVFKRGLMPEAFVDILPPSALDFHYRFSSANTVGHLQFRLTRLPDDYYILISRMEPALEQEIEQLRPFGPEGAGWWDAEKVRANFDSDSFVFRKLPLGVGDAVYIAASEAGEVYAWVDR